MPPAFPFSSPLSSLPSSSRTTPSLDDLIYAMETEVAEAVVPIKVPGEEISEVGEKEAIVLRTTTSEVVNTTLPASPLLPNTSVPINEPYPTALTNRTVHTNGGKKRQSQSICTGPPTKRFRVDSGGPHFDADFFSPSLSHRAPHPHPHGHSIRPAPTSPDRVVVRVRRVGVMKAYNTKSQQRPQPQVQKHPKSKARVKKISESVKPVQEKRDTTTRYLRQQPDKVSSTSKMATKAPTKPASAGKSGTTRSRALRMIVESDSDSSDSDEEDRTKVAERRSSSPLSSVMSSETEEEENGDESADEVDSDEEEDEIVEKKAKSKLRGSAKSSKASTRTKPSSSAFPKPPSPLDPRDAEIIGLLIETMAQSRASSHTVSVLYKSLLENRAGVLVRLAEGLEPKDEEGEVEAKQKRGEKDWWMYELVRVLELGMTRCGMFGRVDSSGRDSSDRLMEAHYFYVPERDEDQERATLIRSIMPRAGKRNETKKYKQYYWKPVEGKRLRWDAVDGI
ncbi:hypothetical protein E1B28_003882 [Marasmius oreades]|uniref:Uncharacterized protein n=1 Tax=Marasmius oreades TaxID=181124 RepID=A0A9P8AB56_9AGAR|nr:uncharacterized protein E1B28_003882 [Marasmius oreades]KAG7096446.1 hypothetical protein E1B28_003882 [Marasmius oreades]